MIETSNLTGAGEIVEALGQAWTLAHVGPGLRGKYSAWLKARARRGLRDELAAGSLSVDEYREEADALKRQLDAGSYNWGSPFHATAMGDAIAASLAGLDGKMKLLQLLLESAHGIVPPDKVLELMQAAPEAMAEVIGTCLDPNRQVPVSRPGEAKR